MACGWVCSGLFWPTNQYQVEAARSGVDFLASKFPHHNASSKKPLREHPSKIHIRTWGGWGWAGMGTFIRSIDFSPWYLY